MGRGGVGGHWSSRESMSIGCDDEPKEEEKEKSRWKVRRPDCGCLGLDIVGRVEDGFNFFNASQERV